uniref:Uncharacterized protein n=1 Tax=Glossina austeni TaxID=7395 RepID=A0A1A9V132_GLOAU
MLPIKPIYPFLPGKVAKKPHQSNRPVKIDRNQKHRGLRVRLLILVSKRCFLSGSNVTRTYGSEVPLKSLAVASFELSALLLLPDVFDGTAALEDLSLSKFTKLNACALPYGSKPSLRPDYMQKCVEFYKLFMQTKNGLLKWLINLWRFPPNLNLKMRPFLRPINIYCIPEHYNHINKIIEQIIIQII